VFKALRRVSVDPSRIGAITQAALVLFGRPPGDPGQAMTGTRTPLSSMLATKSGSSLRDIVDDATR